MLHIRPRRNDSARDTMIGLRENVHVVRVSSVKLMTAEARPSRPTMFNVTVRPLVGQPPLREQVEQSTIADRRVSRAATSPTSVRLARQTRPQRWTCGPGRTLRLQCFGPILALVMSRSQRGRSPSREGKCLPTAGTRLDREFRTPNTAI